MAAYAALVSVMHIIEQIQNHPRPPISLDREQVQSLTEKVTFLQDFLEGYSNINGGGSEDAEVLESRIADAAYTAEDIIESHIVDQIQAPYSTSTDGHGETISSVDLYQGLERVIGDVDLIKREMADFTKKMGIQDDQLHSNYPMPAAGSLRRSPSSSRGQDTVVGLDDVLVEVKDKLTGQRSSCQIIPIVGMGGIGKTTLAKNVYVDPLIVHYFDFRGWATISQDYNSKEILLQVLVCLKTIGSKESMSGMSEDELGDKLHKSLSGRRYLIVMDDIWSIEAWDTVKVFFPDNSNGSRIIITTRLSNLAFQLSGSDDVLKMKFLDEDNSWNLFCKSAFGEKEDCPLELKEIGRKMAQNCKGLPLSIIVVGGLLAKSKRTREYWLYIAENLNSIVSLECNERCIRILRLSYNQLPVQLKPCFLYMGVFPEDCDIYVPQLMKLWAAEGFLKPIRGKCLEVVAEEYFNDLIDRNLVLVSRKGCSGKTKFCKIHDLLVDLCVREAQKHKFLCVTTQHNLNNPKAMNTQRRIVVREGTKLEVIRALRSASLVRSLTFNNSSNFSAASKSRLLKVWNGYDVSTATITSLESTRAIVNCQYLDSLHIPNSNPRFSSSIYLLWNLQTLIVRNTVDVTPFEIWKMPQLRHVKIDKLKLPDPPITTHTDVKEDDFVVLENLQTLSEVRNFKCGEGVAKRILNIKKLGLYYKEIEEPAQDHCLNNLIHLLKLESLSCRFDFGEEPNSSELQENLAFPRSLQKLSLEGIRLNWEDMATKIGSLPHLQVLKLYSCSFNGPEWETVEGQFRSLKYLKIFCCNDLEYWRTESHTHFPCLEHLLLTGLNRLQEIPSEIGDIPTLKSIELDSCSDSANISAKEILQEQEDLGNVDLQLRVVPFKRNQEVQSLASPNFQVNIW